MGTYGAKYLFFVLFLLFKECALLAVVIFGLQAVSIPENKGHGLMEPWCVCLQPWAGMHGTSLVSGFSGGEHT